MIISKKTKMECIPTNQVQIPFIQPMTTIMKKHLNKNYSKSSWRMCSTLKRMMVIMCPMIDNISEEVVDKLRELLEKLPKKNE